MTIGPAPDNESAQNVTQQDLETILDSLVEGVLTLDEAGRILGVNRAACEILKVQKRRALGADCCELLDEQLRGSTAAVCDAIRDGKPLSDCQVQVRTRSRRKMVLVFQTNSLSIAKRDRRGGVVVIRDVTELAALKEELARRRGRHDRAEGVTRPADPPRDSLGPDTVRDALEATGWNVAQAARRLRVSRTTLYKRIAALGIRRPEG
jgi:PAS domain S-box-containing protein